MNSAAANRLRARLTAITNDIERRSQQLSDDEIDERKAWIIQSLQRRAERIKEQIAAIEAEDGQPDAPAH